MDLPSARTALGLLDNYVRFFAAHYLPHGRDKRRGGAGATGEPRDTHKAPLTLVPSVNTHLCLKKHNFKMDNNRSFKADRLCTVLDMALYGCQE